MFESSYLTALRESQTRAYAYNRQLTYNYNRPPGNNNIIGNPQVGAYDASTMPYLKAGILKNVYRTGGPLPLVSDPSCTCTSITSTTPGVPVNNYIQSSN